jgi:hypothetical protein
MNSFLIDDVKNNSSLNKKQKKVLKKFIETRNEYLTNSKQIDRIQKMITCFFVLFGLYVYMFLRDTLLNTDTNVSNDAILINLFLISFTAVVIWVLFRLKNYYEDDSRENLAMPLKMGDDYYIIQEKKGGVLIHETEESSEKEEDADSYFDIIHVSFSGYMNKPDSPFDGCTKFFLFYNKSNKKYYTLPESLIIFVSNDNKNNVNLLKRICNQLNEDVKNESSKKEGEISNESE